MRGGLMPTTEKEDIKAENLNGVYSELVAVIGLDGVIKLHSKYRGTQLFFPLDFFSKEYIIGRIVKEFNGHNIRELAIRYGYTEKWIRKILKDNSDSI